MRSIYVKFGLQFPYGIDFWLFRLGGVGLGNLLITWARAEVASIETGASILAPTWTQICPGPIRRNEKDFRIYNKFFVPSTRYVKGVRALKILLGSVKVSEAKVKKDGFNDGECLVLEGIEGLFIPLKNHRAEIRKRFLDIAIPGRYFPLSPIRNVIAVHIRRGDFCLLGWETDARWFTREVVKQIARYHPDAVEIYTDGPGEHALNEILPACGVVPTYLVEETSTLLTLTRMASCVHIIGSNRSTFSMWAAFLSSGNSSFEDMAYVQKCGLPYSEVDVSDS